GGVEPPPRSGKTVRKRIPRCGLAASGGPAGPAAGPPLAPGRPGLSRFGPGFPPPAVSDDTTNLHPIPTTQPQPVTAWLVVTAASSSGTVGRSFRISADEAVVGRSPDAQIRLQEEGVSRRHARLVRSSLGQFELSDLGSTNGTYL